VFVADARLEEFIGGEFRVTGFLQDGDCERRERKVGDDELAGPGFDDFGCHISGTPLTRIY